MKVSRRCTEQKTALSIEGDCTIYHVEALKQKLLLDSKGFDRPVVLNLKKVEEIDTAGVQIVLMLNKLVSKSGGSLSLNGLSDSVMRALNSLNLPAPFTLSEPLHRQGEMQ